MPHRAPRPAVVTVSLTVTLCCVLIVLAALPATARGEARHFPETGHTVREPFLSAWQRGGVELFGYPISGELAEPHPETGLPHTVQYFERARLELDPASGRITLGLVGRELLEARGLPAPSPALEPASSAPEPVAPPLLTVAAPGAPVAELVSLAGPQPAGELPSEAVRLVELVNAERAAVGLEPLAVAPELTAAAQAYSAEMAATGWISHTGADGRGPAQRMLDAGYRWLRCGENLAVGQLTPEEAMAFWMGSPPHRANILDPQLREIGAGYFWQDGGYGHYWTINLGVR